jgi:hypothetical protein
MFALKGVFSRPGIFNKVSRIFKVQPPISFVSAWAQHYMPVTHKTRKVNQTIIVILICCYFYTILIPLVILVVSITIGITIRMAITMRITIGITITKGMRIWILVGIAIIITRGGITTGICIRIKMRITIRITIGFTITISIIRITTLKKNNDLWAQCCWKTGQTDTWTDP